MKYNQRTMKQAIVLSLTFLIISLFSGCNKEELASLPVISTTPLTKITGISLASGGNITSDGGARVTARGIYWSTNPYQTVEENKTSDGAGTGIFKSNMSGLNGSTTYFVRAYATNNTGTAYGNQVSFTTPISDIDGNDYHSITIGTQTWMVENLRVTHFNDGSDIELITSDLEWKTSKDPSYCWYYNIVPVEGDNGALYNFYTINTGKLCPTEWHVPSDGEWKTLEIFLGMSQAESAMENWRGEGTSALLKSAKGWYVLNGSQDMYGFKAMPAGFRQGMTGAFEDYNQGTFWWSSTIFDDSNGWFRSIDSDETAIYRGNLINQNGFSVRCIKDN
jgi:uncharacterized protein (TIGR02145 family)